MYSGTSYSISFSEISGYIVPQTQTGILTDNTTISVEYEKIPLDYLNFTARNGSATIRMSGYTNPNVSYSYDKTNWTTWNFNNITLNENQTVWMKGNNPNGFNTNGSSYRKFVMSGTVEADGSIQSLVYGDNYRDNLTIPSSIDCFYNLFSGCTSLITAPQLPATVLQTQCYQGMFDGCTNLITAPELPATTLTSNCYMQMFANCISLTTAPQLPATTVAYGCYNNMFYGCINLTTAPELPATTLVTYCYNGMFWSCRKLNYVKAMFTTEPIVTESTSYTSRWLYDVAASGTFVKNSAATWNVSGYNGVPEGWTIQYADS